jgi:hypothetical protein
VRFKLNHNSTRLQPGEPDTSIWVGDLTPEVDDFALYNFFMRHYQGSILQNSISAENFSDKF